MKKVLSCLLVLVLCTAFILPASTVTEEEPVTVSFEQLTEMVMRGNASYQRLLQEIGRLQIGLDGLSGQYDEVSDALSVIDAMPDGSQTWQMRGELRSSASELDYRMRSLQSNINAMRGASNNMALQFAFPAQMMYIGHYISLLDLEIALRELENYERELENARLMLARGLSSRRDVRNAERNVDDQKDAVKARRDAIDDNLEALARHLGLTVSIAPAGMPEIEFERFTERDFEADMAAYIDAATVDEQRELDSAIRELRRTNSRINRFTHDSAVQNLETAKITAEADFPKIFDALIEAYEDYLDSTLVADIQEDYDMLAAQYERGLVSRNTLLRVERALENVKSGYEMQRIGLFMTLLEYELGLVKF